MSTVSYRDFTGTTAENYQRYFVPAIATPVSARLLEIARLQPGEHVLDIACGTGVIARLAAEAVGPTGSVTGIDLAPDMIDVARATPAPAGPSINWHIGDAAALPFPDDTYDTVLCQMGLMFVPDRPAAVAEMRRTLIPGGRAVISTPGAIQPPFELLEQVLVEHISADLGGFVRAVFSMHDPGTLAAILRGADLRDVTVTVERATLRLPAPVEFLWQYINCTPMDAVVGRVPEAVKKAMERDIAERWQPYVGKTGALVGEQPMVTAIGWK